MTSTQQLPTTVAWEFFRQRRRRPTSCACAWRTSGTRSSCMAARPTLCACRVPAAPARQRIRHVREPVHEVHAVSALGEYQNWVNNVSELDGVRPERELRARADAALLDRRERAQRGRHAEAGRHGRRSRPTARRTSRRSPGCSPASTYPTLPGERQTWVTTSTSSATWSRFDDRSTTRAPRSLLGGASAATAGGNAAVGGARPAPRAGRPSRTRRRSSWQLIQKTVTSSPTPATSSRVAAVFKNNGTGVRGDLAAVTQGDPARSRSARRAQDRPGVRPPARARRCSGRR